jgi:hypothetical protein
MGLEQTSSTMICSMIKPTVTWMRRSPARGITDTVCQCPYAALFAPEAAG